MAPKSIFGVLISLSNCRVPGLNGFSFQTVLTQLQVLRNRALLTAILQLLRGDGSHHSGLPTCLLQRFPGRMCEDSAGQLLEQGLFSKSL